jgi:hypothetical protein
MPRTVSPFGSREEQERFRKLKPKGSSPCAPTNEIKQSAGKTDRQETGVSSLGNQWGNSSPGRQATPLGGSVLTSFGFRYDDRTDQIDDEAACEKDGKSGRKALNRSARQRNESWHQPSDGEADIPG